MKKIILKHVWNKTYGPSKIFHSIVEAFAQVKTYTLSDPFFQFFFAKKSSPYERPGIIIVNAEVSNETKLRRKKWGQ